MTAICNKLINDPGLHKIRHSSLVLLSWSCLITSFATRQPPYKQSLFFRVQGKRLCSQVARKHIPYSQSLAIASKHNPKDRDYGGGGRDWGTAVPQKFVQVRFLGNKRKYYLAKGFLKRFHLFREITMSLKKGYNNTGTQYRIYSIKRRPRINTAFCKGNQMVSSSICVFQKAEIALDASASAISGFWKVHKCKLVPN